ncbi:helix-turn-helix transcriptional regulator [Dendrosporobacter sp. 1207_IL3150]|uniref:helix-turn-helix transcriptional regulator n=1 Tax=Dendrosporobacter sp. 1207_IL3150 TaxID=3084054 RepID=UPI003FA52AC4
MKHPLGEKLRYARQQLGYTQEELAEKLGFSRSLINHYELGRKYPRLKKLQLLANILGRPQDFFLDDRITVLSQD